MANKLSKEEEIARKAIIDKGIALVGIKRYEYLGEPTDHKSWRKLAEKKRMGNRGKDLTDRGKGPDSKGAKHVAGDQSGKEE